MKYTRIFTGLLATAVAATVIFSACKKDKNGNTSGGLFEIKGDLDYGGLSDTIKIDLGGGNQLSSIPTFDGELPGQLPFAVEYPFATDYEKYLKQYGTSKDLVKEIRFKTLSLEYTFPSKNDFDFMDSVRVFLRSTGLPDKMIAYQYGNNGATNVKKLNMQVITDNIKDYYLKDSITLTVKAHTHAGDTLFLPTQFKLGAVFSILANPVK